MADPVTRVAETDTLAELRHHRTIEEPILLTLCPRTTVRRQGDGR